MKKFFLITPVLMFFVLASFISNLYAWSVNYNFQAKNIKVDIEEEVENIHPYLVWADLTDGNEAKFFSLVQDRGWVNDILPVVSEPIDLPAFGEVELGSLPAECVEGHKCYLFMVAIEAGHEPYEFEAWEKFSIFPLSVEAAMERWPGQSHFISTSNGRREEPMLLDATDTAAASQNNSQGEGQPDTEKPDIFKVDGSKIFYANSRANKFQVIDWSIPSQPKLVSSLPIQGIPKEIYSLNGHYILLMNKVNRDNRRDNVTLLESYVLKNGQLELEHSLQVNGFFIESRRRNNLIYLITRSPRESTQSSNSTSVWHPPLNDLMVIAMEITPEGRIVEKARKRVTGLPYNTVTAIFPNYLIYAHENFEHERIASIVTIFDISNPNHPLPAPKSLDIKGRIPSEFHMDVKDKMLRLVSSPASWDEDSGSSLWVFDLSKNPPLKIGYLDGIAPGEQLFATRFEEERAYVVTYERRDPLWVIDLSNPTNPKILGELEVPGWSEKLFINNGKLFSLGIYDQPITPQDEPDGWYRRIAVSLFDVNNPTNPALIDRIVPLADKGTMSYSLALDDERALLLDWDKQFCAFPMQINRYNDTGKTYLQICKFNDDSLEDVGAAAVPVDLERPIYLAEKLLGGIGSLAFYTVDWNSLPQVIGSVELARNYSWIDYHNGLVWAAISLDYHDIFKLFGFRPDNLEEPVYAYHIDRKYNYLEIDNNYALFYSRSPLKVTLLNLNNGNHSEEYILESSNSDSNYYGTIIFKNKKIYGIENEMINPDDPLPAIESESLPSCVRPYRVNLMRIWEMQDENHRPELILEASVPGQLIGITNNNKLVFKEAHGNKTLLNLVQIEDGRAVLKKSKQLECASWSIDAVLTEADKIFLTCAPYDSPPIVIMDEGAESASPPERSIMPMPESKLLAIDPETLKITASIRLGRDSYIQDAFSNFVLVNEQGYIRPMEATTVSADVWRPNCSIYKLNGHTFQKIKDVAQDLCNARDVAISDTMLFTAHGMEGLKKMKFE